jgi:integrase
LLTAGVHPKVVSEALGHSSVAFTMDVYQHVLPTMGEQVAQAIEATLGRS